jgi:RDD family
MEAQPETPLVPASRSRYADPAGRYVARFATPWRRIVAAAVDWGLCYVLFVLVSIPLGMVQTVGAVSREENDLGGVPGYVMEVVPQFLIFASIVAYWVILLPTSHTFGMRVTDIRVVSTRTGRGPSYLVAVIRGAIATLIAAAVYAVYLDRTAIGDRELDETSLFLLDVSYVVTAAAALSALVMVVTPSHRSILDRIFGSAVLDELEATQPHLGPWGPVDAFDTSNRRVRARLDA